MKNRELLEKLAQRTIDYCNNELSVNIENDFKIIKIDKIDYFDISALISLSNDMLGTVGMSVTNELANKMVEGFIFGDISKEEISELASENIAETLNITMGNILKELTVIKEGGTVNISTPYTMHNSVTITKKENGLMYLCKLKSKNETILLSYFK